MTAILFQVARGEYTVVYLLYVMGVSSFNRDADVAIPTWAHHDTDTFPGDAKNESNRQQH